MTRPDSIAVLGCGPAGLMAAHAAAVLDIDKVHIFSKPRKSEMFGAQYLHAPIPGMTNSAPVTVSYQLQGTVEEYRRKVYGVGWTGEVSPQELEGEHDAWDIRDTYNALWDAYGEYVQPAEQITPSFLSAIHGKYDLIVSTIPAQALCSKPQIHQFISESIWALGDAPERGQRIAYQCPDNTVICNGEDSPSWYRISKLFGYKTVEWAARTKPPFSVAAVQKPLYNNCDCFPDVMRSGRYGKWTKGVLSHQSFQEVFDRCMQ